MDRSRRPNRTETVQTDGGDRTVDGLSEALADSRRRLVVSELVASDGRVALRDIVDRIVEEERDSPHEETPSEIRKRVRTALVQVHLPKLAEADVADRDDEGHTVVPISSLDDAQALLEPADGTGGSV